MSNVAILGKSSLEDAASRAKKKNTKQNKI